MSKEQKIILETIYIATIVGDMGNTHFRSRCLSALLRELGINESFYKSIKDKLRHAEAKNIGVVKASQTGVFFTHKNEDGNEVEILFRKF